MTIDPRWSFWLSILLATLSFLGGAGSQFADLGLSPAVVKAVLAAIAIVVGVGNALNAVLAAIPNKTGPGAANAFYLGPKEKDKPQ